MSPKIKRFRCWWCNRVLGLKKLHHAQRATKPIRRCCFKCARDPGGAFLLVYPGGAHEEAESIRRNQEQEIRL